MIFGLAILIAFLALSIAMFIYTKSDHYTPKTGETLQRGAKIVSVESKPVPLTQYIRTVIEFSDGFRFTTYKSVWEDNFFFKKAIVPDEMRENFKDIARIYHDGLLDPKAAKDTNKK